MSNRSSGILLHISSLPSSFGIGDLGPGAYRFIDRLHAAKQKYWQILPINPTDAISSHSPYSSLSAFAGNKLFISPELLREDGFLTDKDLDSKPSFPDERVDYEVVLVYKSKLLDLAFDRFLSDANVRKQHMEAYEAFLADSANWLNDYALFVTIKAQQKGALWTSWPEGLRRRDPKTLRDFKKKHGEAVERVMFAQFLFYKQWDQLKDYSRQKNVKFFGDLAIYMNLDSADVWLRPKNYKLDAQLRPITVSGVPPDYFSNTGQRWGTPVYNWDVLKADGYAWWVERFRCNFRLFDTVRIDHFRGLVQFWEIPEKNKTAVKGSWGNVPTDDFFKTLEKAFSAPLPIIAEDLGYITEDVREAMRRLGFPGMKILLFAFNGNMQDHPYLPHNFKERCVVYTGTHDNNTTLGWFRQEATGDEIRNIREYLHKEVTQESICRDLIGLAMRSEAEIAIIPMQDVLELGEAARMNVPGTMGSHNWAWRMRTDGFHDTAVKYLRDMTESSNRG